VASAVLNTAQWIGGSLGTALLNTLFAGAVTAYFTDNPITDPAEAAATTMLALLHGYHVAFFWGAMLLFAGFLVAVFVVNAKKEDVPDDASMVTAA
jgi:hypothetical protein